MKKTLELDADIDFDEIPSSFLWGAATSAHQVEGYNEKNDWWAWEAQGRIEGGARSGPATDHWNRFKEDLRLAADLGLNAYRFSIEWSRIEPEKGRFDESALQWYAELLAECERLGLLPMATLHHFTSPQWFAEEGGFSSPRAADDFARFTSKIAESLGPRIPLWCTLNEPMVLVAGTYIGQFMPPAIFAPKLASHAIHQLLKSHVRAYRILHSEIRERSGPWKDHPLAVGIAHNFLDFRPDRKWHPMEATLTRLFHRAYNRSWPDAVTGRGQRFWIPGLLPAPKIVPEAVDQNTVDFIGVNYYTKAYVQWRWKASAQGGPAELPIRLSFARRNEEVSDLGWSIHPRGLRRVLGLAARYRLPLYITENGIADRNDALRPSYLASHLAEMARAIEKGVDIRGYYHWSLLDNFEWIKGFGPRFGLFKVDYDTFERTTTDSARLYQKIIRRHRGDRLPSDE